MRRETNRTRERKRRVRERRASPRANFAASQRRRRWHNNFLIFIFISTACIFTINFPAGIAVLESVNYFVANWKLSTWMCAMRMRLRRFAGLSVYTPSRSHTNCLSWSDEKLSIPAFRIRPNRVCGLHKSAKCDRMLIKVTPITLRCLIRFNAAKQIISNIRNKFKYEKYERHIVFSQKICNFLIFVKKCHDKALASVLFPD